MGTRNTGRLPSIARKGGDRGRVRTGPGFPCSLRCVGKRQPRLCSVPSYSRWPPFVNTYCIWARGQVRGGVCAC